MRERDFWAGDLSLRGGVSGRRRRGVCGERSSPSSDPNSPSSPPSPSSASPSSSKTPHPIPTSTFNSHLTPLSRPLTSADWPSPSSWGSSWGTWRERLRGERGLWREVSFSPRPTPSRSSSTSTTSASREWACPSASHSRLSSTQRSGQDHLSSRPPSNFQHYTHFSSNLSSFFT